MTQFLIKSPEGRVEIIPNLAVMFFFAVGTSALIAAMVLSALDH